MKFAGGAGLLVSALLCACPAPSAAPMFRLGVAKAGDGHGQIVSSPASVIDCGSTCTRLLTAGTELTLEARPLEDSTFDGWVDGCSGTEPCTITMSSDLQVNALFTAKHVPITISRVGDGEGRVVSNPSGLDCGGWCTASFLYGRPVMLHAEASFGSRFAGWRGGGCSFDTDEDCRVLPNASTGTIEATFSKLPPPPPPLFRVVKQGPGTGVVRSTSDGIECGNDCTENWPTGTVIELRASPDTGSVFDGWNTGGSGSFLLRIGTSDQTVTAKFSLSKHSLTVVKAGAGTGLVSSTGITCGTDCSEDFAYGSTVALVQSAAPGSWFAGWSEGHCGVDDLQCSFTMTAPRSVTTAFVPVARLGNATPFAQGASIQPNQVIAEQFVIPDAGTAHALGLILFTGSTTGRLALYSDESNLPGALLAQTNDRGFSATQAVGHPLEGGPLNLDAGTYWVAAILDQSAMVGAEPAASNLTASRNVVLGSPFPDPFGATVAASGQRYNLFLLIE